MAARQHGNQGSFDDGFVPHDDFADLVAQAGVYLAEVLNLFFGAHVIDELGPDGSKDAAAAAFA
jgi:hypothetical protein